MKKNKNILMLLGVLAVVLLVFGILSGGGVFSSGTIETFGFQLPEFGLFTFGMMITILTGGINLSVISTAALSGILAALVLTESGLDTSDSIAVAIIVCIASAAVMGCINGALISYLNVPPMIITLGTSTLFEGISLNVTQGGAISGFSEEFFTIGSSSILGIPAPLLLFVIVAVGLYFALEKTVWGEKVYIVGSNPKVSHFSGISNQKTLFSVYIISGVLSGLAALVMISRYNSAKVDFGAAYLLQTVAAAVLGGTSITGGFGKVFGTVIAVVIIQAITTGFNYMGISKLYTDILIGIVLVVVVAMGTIGSFGKAKLEPIKKDNDLPDAAK